MACFEKIAANGYTYPTRKRLPFKQDYASRIHSYMLRANV